MNQAYYARLKRRINQPELFSGYNGIQVTEIREHYAEGVLTMSPQSMNPRGIVHGGCLSTLMDTVAGIAACTDGRGCVTLNCTVSYLRSAQGAGQVRCTVKPVKVGRTIAVYEAQCLGEDGRQVATGTYTFFLKELLPEAEGKKEE